MITPAAFFFGHGWPYAVKYKDVRERCMPMDGRQKIAPRQLLLHCSNKLHPCSDAFSAFPPSVVVVCSECMDAQDAYKEVGGRKRMERVFERRCSWMGSRALKDGESENGFTQNKLEARI